MKHNIFGKLLLSVATVLAAFTLTACVDDNEDKGMPTLEVEATELAFTLEGGDAAFMLNTNRPWTATLAEGSDWITIDPMEGDGKTRIELSIPAATTGRIGSVSFHVANSYEVFMTRTIEIRQGTIEPEVALWHEHFGTPEKVDNNWPLVADYTGWEKGGTVGADVTYGAPSGKMSVRAASPMSEEYADASGSGKLFFGTGAPAFVAGNIAATGKTIFTLNFGVAYNNYNDNAATLNPEEFRVYVSGDNTKWSRLNYTLVAAGSKWHYATAAFTLKEASEKLFIKLVADEPSVISVDDMQLVAGGVGGEEIDLAQGSENTSGDGGGDDPSDPTPTPGETTPTSISELNGMMGSSTVTVDKNYQFEAIVLSDVAGGNYTGNNLVLQTEGSKTAGNGVVLYGSEVDPSKLALVRGDKVKVTLVAGKAQLKIYNNLKEITGNQGETWCTVEKIGTGTVEPTVVTLDQMESFQSMLVTVKEATAPAAGTWCTADGAGTHKFKVGSGELTIYVKKAAAAFAGKAFKATTGDVTGVVTMYNKQVQLAPRDLNDVAAFAEGGSTPEPPAPAGALTVKELVQLMIAGTAYTDKSVEGYVAAFGSEADVENVSKGSIVLTDNDGAEYSGVTVYNYELASGSYKVGDKLSIKLTNAVTGDYKGLRQLTKVKAEDITILSSGATIQHKTLTGARLNADWAKYLSVPVQIANAKPVSASVGKTFATSLTFNDGADFTVYNRSKWVAGAEVTVGDKTGTIRGAVSVYDGAPQLNPLTKEDIAAFAADSSTPDPNPDPSGEGYAEITTITNLAAGDYFIGGFGKSGTLQLFIGQLKSKNGVTVVYTYDSASGALSTEATDQAITVTLEAVEGNANSYRIKCDGKYLIATQAKSGNLALVDSTEYYWTFEDKDNTGMRVMQGGADAPTAQLVCSVGTDSNIMRSGAASTEANGIRFYKKK